MDYRALKMLKDMVRDGSRIRVAVKGQSMRPLLRSGDIVELKPLAAAPKAGEIAAVHWRSQIVLHRVVRVEGRAGDRRVFLRGDGQLREHGPHTEDDLIGRLARVSRGGRWMDPVRWALRDRASRALALARRARAALRGASR